MTTILIVMQYSLLIIFEKCSLLWENVCAKRNSRVSFATEEVLIINRFDAVGPHTMLGMQRVRLGRVEVTELTVRSAIGVHRRTTHPSVTFHTRTRDMQ
jgi:hypothetical protein